VVRPPKSVSRNSGRLQATTSEAPPVAVRAMTDATSVEAQHESAAAEEPDSRSDTGAIDGAHRLIGRHADVPAPGRTTDSPEPAQAQADPVRSQPKPSMLRL